MTSLKNKHVTERGNAQQTKRRQADRKGDAERRVPGNISVERREEDCYCMI